ncbi:hypothetical protein [Saccharopolyspora cebuensis]|uniref:Uncharacterized protein n=1 Tax=Saccharopolyspora cebuensis TaxID=418759 RepID=A0ABV4CM70_9PSEU
MSEEVPVGRWVAAGYQNHVVPRSETPPLLAALCGVLSEPGELSAPDGRPTCSVCSAAVRAGRIVLG